MNNLKLTIELYIVSSNVIIGKYQNLTRIDDLRVGYMEKFDYIVLDGSVEMKEYIKNNYNEKEVVTVEGVLYRNTVGNISIYVEKIKKKR